MPELKWELDYFIGKSGRGMVWTSGVWRIHLDEHGSYRTYRAGGDVEFKCDRLKEAKAYCQAEHDRIPPLDESNFKLVIVNDYPVWKALTDKLRYEDDELLLNGRSRCYLSHDFSKVEIYSTRLVVCPERLLLNGKQIQEWVADLRQNPKVFATNSLYLLRELYLQKIDVEYNNDGVISTDLDALGDLEVLDREIEQSDRYLKAEN